MIGLPGALALVWQLKDGCTRFGRVQQRSVIQRTVQLYKLRLKSLMVQTQSLPLRSLLRRKALRQDYRDALNCAKPLAA
jgi:hypothetical protein